MLAPVPDAPSPAFHAYDAIVPSGSEPEPLSMTAMPAGAFLSGPALATGGGVVVVVGVGMVVVVGMGMVVVVGVGMVVVVAHAGVVAFAATLEPDRFPALSTALTVYEYAVDGLRPVSEVEVDGVSTCVT